MNGFLTWPCRRAQVPQKKIERLAFARCTRRGVIVSRSIAVMGFSGSLGMAFAQSHIFDELKSGAEKALVDAIRTPPQAAPPVPLPDSAPEAASPAPRSSSADGNGAHNTSIPRSTELARPAYPGRSRVLKIGQSSRGLDYRKVGKNAVVMAGGKVLFKCDAADDLDISAPSPGKGLVLVACVDQDRGPYISRILDVKGARQVAHSSCEEVEAKNIVAWSPKEDYVVLNMVDEAFQKWGILNLNSGRTKCVDAPNNEAPEVGEFRWPTSTTAIYRGDRCEDTGIPWSELNRHNCKVLFTYEIPLDMVSARFGEKRIVRGEGKSATSGR